MGSSRASTPAGRHRTAARRGVAGRRPAPKHSGGKKPAAKAAPAKSAKKPPKRTAPKARKPAPKLKQPKRKAPKRAAAPLTQRLPRLFAVAAVVLAVLTAGYLVWFRNSPLVAVENVSITGISGPEEERARTALASAAREMTTLNVDEDGLRAAVAGLPTVAGVEVEAGFPHDLTVTVTERPPVLIVRAGERALPVAGDGTILPGVEQGEVNLPSIRVGELPAKGTLTGDGLRVALVMGAAPGPLRQLVQDVAVGGQGVRVTLRDDIPIQFGGSENAADKWAAVAAILADPKIDTLTYIDVRVPGRPALGGAAPAVTEDTTDATEPETAATTPQGP